MGTLDIPYLIQTNLDRLNSSWIADNTYFRLPWSYKANISCFFFLNTEGRSAHLGNKKAEDNHGVNNFSLQLMSI